MIESSERKIGAVAAGIFAVGMNIAQAEGDSAWAYDAYVGGVSGYVLSIKGQKVAGPSLRNIARVTHKESGFFGEAWRNEALIGTDKGSKTSETDITGGVVTPCGGVICELGVGYYRVENGTNLNIIHPYGRVQKTFDNRFGKTTVRVEQNANFFPDDDIGTIYTTQGKVSQVFPEVLGVAPDLSIEAYRNWGANDGDLFNVRVDGGFSVPINEHIIFSAGAVADFPDKQKKVVTFRAGLSFSW